MAKPDGPEFVRGVQLLLDPLCLVGLQINPEARVSVLAGPAERHLVEKGWKTFLVKVQNDSGITSALRVESPQALPLAGSPPGDVDRRWLQLEWQRSPPLTPTLSGLRLEYQILAIYSRDAGQRAAVLRFDAGSDTRGLGFTSEITLLFDATPTRCVRLRVRERGGEPLVAAFEIRDLQDRAYPSMQKRLAPDFAFHPQIYRSDGDTVCLPNGRYLITCSRGPEYKPSTQTLEVTDTTTAMEIELERWIDPSDLGWWSGDHHIHAAGCSHYSEPTKGVLARDMFLHCRGEDLKVGCNLTWGPCFDYQSQFFVGTIDPVSVYPHLLRYDIEVAGFGSHKSGHLCLLGLREQIPPGASSKNYWPTLGLNTLRWAKAQGAVCGSAHSGLGLMVESQDLPNYEPPPFDGVGAHELVIDVTHTVPGPDKTLVPAIDFFSTCDTHAVRELNMWYHLLNCGFGLRIAGETDFPCLSDARLGMGRSYVKVDGTLTFEAWIDGIRRGRSYVSDGRSHLIDFSVNGFGVGSGDGTVGLASPGNVTVRALVAGRLDRDPDPSIDRELNVKPYWHLEKARIADSRKVRVEVVVNGESVANQAIIADGESRQLEFSVPIMRSSWVALRIFPSSHTNPVFVMLPQQPIRASRRSAVWCLEGVDKCWTEKASSYAAPERQQALDAYEHARMTYRRIRDESPGDGR